MSCCLHFSRYWAICMLKLFVSLILTSQILKLNLIFLIKSFFYMTKKSRQKFKYLGNKKSLYSETRFFISFKGLSIANNCLRPYSAPLRISSVNASISADKIRKILEQSGKLAKTRR